MKTDHNCEDRAYKHYKSNPIPTSILYITSYFDYALRLLGRGYLCSIRMPCLACTLSFLHIVSVVFDNAIPTSLYILIKCLLYFFMCFLVVKHKSQRAVVGLNKYDSRKIHVASFPTDM